MRGSISFLRCAFLDCAVCLLGGAIWFGVQTTSGLDNFSDQINPWYFLIYYAGAFVVGLLARARAAEAGILFVLSQVVCYQFYPNVKDQLGNLYPVAAALLLICTAPAGGVAYLASRIGMGDRREAGRFEASSLKSNPISAVLRMVPTAALGILLAFVAAPFALRPFFPLQTQAAAPSATSRQPPEPRFRVVDLSVRADPSAYAGPCPVTITLSGRISVAGGSGVVRYRWVQSDRITGPGENLYFDGPGSQDIRTTWQIGASGDSFSGWEAIETFEPAPGLSNHAEFSVRCIR